MSRFIAQTEIPKGERNGDRCRDSKKVVTLQALKIIGKINGLERLCIQ